MVSWVAAQEHKYSAICSMISSAALKVTDTWMISADAQGMW
jgi:hypothetical protein